MKYEIIENTRNVKYSNRNQIADGCTLEQDNQFPRIMESFDNKADALEALKKYEGKVYKVLGNTGAYFEVTEYYVEKNEYDEDGEWIGGGDICEFSGLPDVKCD